MHYFLIVLRCQLIKILPSTLQVWLTTELSFAFMKLWDCIKNNHLDQGCLFWLCSLIFFFFLVAIHVFVILFYCFVIYLQNNRKGKNSWTFQGDISIQLDFGIGKNLLYLLIFVLIIRNILMKRSGRKFNSPT